MHSVLLVSRNLLMWLSQAEMEKSEDDFHDQGDKSVDVIVM